MAKGMFPPESDTSNRTPASSEPLLQTLSPRRPQARPPLRAKVKGKVRLHGKRAILAQSHTERTPAVKDTVPIVVASVRDRHKRILASQYYVKKAESRLNALTARQALSPEEYRKHLQQMLDYVSKYVWYVTRAQNTGAHISASLMFLNTAPTARPAFSELGLAETPQALKGVLEIDAFCQNQAWDTPYIAVPYYDGSQQLIGAPMALHTHRIQFVEDTCALPADTPEGLRRYFAQQQTRLRSFMAIPLYTDITENQPLGVLNINADQAHYFARHLNAIEDIIATPLKKWFRKLLQHRPSAAADTPLLPADGYHQDFIDTLLAGLPPLSPAKVAEIQAHLPLFKAIFGDRQVDQEMTRNDGKLTETLIKKLVSESCWTTFYQARKGKYTYLMTECTGAFAHYPISAELTVWQALENFPLSVMASATEKGIAVVAA